MKRFFKPAVWLSLLMGVLIIGVSSLGVVLAQRKILTTGIVTQNDKNYRKYFKARDINQEVSTHYNLRFEQHREKILWYFTNWSTSNNGLISFNKAKVSNSLLSFSNDLLSQQPQFNKTDQLYINAKYELVNNQSLIVDFRWAKLDALRAQENVELFWEMRKINLS